jgi:hypothetical protein
LLAVAHYLIGHLSYRQVPALAKRHKVEAKQDSASAQELLVKQVGTSDEFELCKLLLEVSLLDSAYQRYILSNSCPSILCRRATPFANAAVALSSLTWCRLSSLRA